MTEERADYILALYPARYAGLRIHECFRMDTAAAERALRENALTVKGKGGKVRIVPIEDDRITMMLQRLLEKTERGHKLLVPDMRITFATLSPKYGVDVKTLSGALGQLRRRLHSQHLHPRYGGDEA